MDCIVHRIAESDMTERLAFHTLMAQLVKNLPAVQETWVPYLGWKDPLEGIKATHSSILAWRIPKDREDWGATVHRVVKSRTRLSN